MQCKRNPMQPPSILWTPFYVPVSRHILQIPLPY